ncbi:hypothetical protein [Oryza sativa Japonica Group]|uniref:Uncharacterized protein n=1 Tax=Oryza sativa subsp. japonica TaxID=39947 RepID=Q5JM54_ORYSJ|nr:hypothetical protein [Oryza sativa Japonica Group]
MAATTTATATRSTRGYHQRLIRRGRVARGVGGSRRHYQIHPQLPYSCYRLQSSCRTLLPPPSCCYRGRGC